MQSEEKKVKVRQERDELIDQFNRLTADWASLEQEFVLGKEKNEERNQLVKVLQLNYWKLDPYVRATTYYHRVGVVTRVGDVDFKAAR